MMMMMTDEHSPSPTLLAFGGVRGLSWQPEDAGSASSQRSSRRGREQKQRRRARRAGRRGADDETVRILAVRPEVPPEHLLEPTPVVGAVAQHHLLHGPPEVAVRVSGLDGQRRGAVERRRRRLFRLHDGARGLGLEQEPAGGGGAESVDDRLVLVCGDGHGGLCWRRGEVEALGRGGVGEPAGGVAIGGAGR